MNALWTNYRWHGHQDMFGYTYPNDDRPFWSARNYFEGQMEHSTRIFTWDPLTRTFVVEMSTISGPARNPRPYTCQIYPDSADEGFFLVSHRTDEVIRFVHERDTFDADNDLIARIFVPCRQHVARFPHLSGITVHILNT